MTTSISLIQLGLGGVGRELVKQVLATGAAQARYGVLLSYKAVLDSSGAVVSEQGLKEDELLSACALKAKGGQLRTHEQGQEIDGPLALVEELADGQTIIVDTTAASPRVVMPAFEVVLERGGGVALANKKPITASWQAWQRLTRDGRIGYEATVGAGLPVISTLRYLLDTGDQLQKIEGAFSGTLGFVMSQLEENAPFADVVREAKARGFTEPDPRDDLSGTDVARKALILARTCGFKLDLSDVSVTALYPPEWAAFSLEDFMARLDALNPLLGKQRDDAHSAGLRLRYAATVEPNALTVGVVAVKPDSPLGVLRGADNLVAFQTARYPTRPLVVQGAGAGVEVTASAVLGDILRIAKG
jgi:homoserine dehydrogenase